MGFVVVMLSLKTRAFVSVDLGAYTAMALKIVLAASVSPRINSSTTATIDIRIVIERAPFTSLRKCRRRSSFRPSDVVGVVDVVVSESWTASFETLSPTSSRFDSLSSLSGGDSSSGARVSIGYVIHSDDQLVRGLSNKGWGDEVGERSVFDQRYDVLTPNEI